jgi:hypothetical protein
MTLEETESGKRISGASIFARMRTREEEISCVEIVMIGGILKGASKPKRVVSRYCPYLRQNRLVRHMMGTVACPKSGPICPLFRTIIEWSCLLEVFQFDLDFLELCFVQTTLILYQHVLHEGLYPIDSLIQRFLLAIRIGITPHQP